MELLNPKKSPIPEITEYLDVMNIQYFAQLRQKVINMKKFNAVKGKS
jgi:hypothetical protein